MASKIPTWQHFLRVLVSRVCLVEESLFTIFMETPILLIDVYLVLSRIVCPRSFQSNGHYLKRPSKPTISPIHVTLNGSINNWSKKRSLVSCFKIISLCKVELSISIKINNCSYLETRFPLTKDAHKKQNWKEAQFF
jgi:hypothetical protein